MNHKAAADTDSRVHKIQQAIKWAVYELPDKQEIT